MRVREIMEIVAGVGWRNGENEEADVGWTETGWRGSDGGAVSPSAVGRHDVQEI